jgi:hypothetical protein
MESDGDMRMLREVLRAAEMYRRELRMRNKVELYQAILDADGGDLSWLEVAKTANQVYAELYVLSKPRQGGDRDCEDQRSADQ